MTDRVTETPVGWVESLLRSKAQIALGESVPLEPLLDRLLASAERLESAQTIDVDDEPLTASR